MAHIHDVIDTDIHYKIDGVTRTITNLNETKRTLAQNDHNSERFTFEIPRYIDGHDLSTCNRVEVHYINIEASGKEQNPGVYEVEDVGVKSDDEETVIFTWLIKNNVTKYAGTVNFIVRFACIDEEGIADYDWHTVIFKSIFISDGIFNSEIIVDNHADILEQWRSTLFDLNDEGVTNIITAKADALQSIEESKEGSLSEIDKAKLGAISVANSIKEDIISEIIQKGNETKEGIPDSYEELSKAVNDMPNTFANALKGNAKGEFLHLTDSTDEKLKGLNLYGKTTQNGTPTPDTPIELNSVDEVALKINRKNLFDVDKFVELVKAYGQTTAYETTVDGRRCLSVINYTLYRKDFSEVMNFEEGKQYTWTMDVKLQTNMMDNPESPCIMYIGWVYDDEDYKTAQIGTNSTAKGATWCKREDYLEFAPIKTPVSVAGRNVSQIAFSYGTNAYWLIDLDSIQIEEGTVATPYEEYTEQTMTLSTQNGLCGIPVSSGGNYTDSNGQQWVCDEVDFEKGVYIQRIGKHTISVKASDTLRTYNFPASEGSNIGQYQAYIASIPSKIYQAYQGVLSEVATANTDKDYYKVDRYTEGYMRENAANIMFFFDMSETIETAKEKINGTKLVYILATPIETPLTEEQLTVYKSLHTYYPITNISNNEGAGMSVNYIADTKNYIDNKFAELQAMILEG